MDNSRAREDQQLDETLEETFPASDAPANTVETGIVARELPPSSRAGVSDNLRKHPDITAIEDITRSSSSTDAEK